MEYLSWDLAIFSAATEYPNLSTAAIHVGVGQPQLSRIVAKLEDQYGLILLDRETRRKSSWTDEAYRLAEIYFSTSKKFRSDVNALVNGLVQRELRVGTIDGLIGLNVDFCQKILGQTNTLVVHLIVADSSTLEKMFVQNDLDLIFVARDIGIKKYRNSLSLGYQSIEAVHSGPTLVYSIFEYQAVIHRGLPSQKTFVSNSLYARSQWLSRHGGQGTLPSDLHPRRTTRSEKKGEAHVLAIAHDTMPPVIWHELKSLILGQK